MKTRIISSAVAIALAIVVIILHETFVFNIVMGLISALAIAEIFRATKHVKYTVPALMCCVYAFIDAVIPVFHRNGWLTFFTSRLYFGALVLSVFVFYLRNHDKYNYKSVFFMLGISILIPYSMGTLIYMAMVEGSRGVYMIVITLAAAWLADSGAYFAGTFLGKTPLCPDISPKKTVEGVVGGVIANGVFMLIITLIFDLATDTFEPRYVVLFFAGCAAALVGLIGDLTASMIKRQVGIKDYGNIMPGHGGVMDRFDSTLLVAPFMYYLFVQGALLK
ncbi:MAG: phosphatidate cytidylyltransferase [Ruminococcus sp.]|nr:phosphatidate cytidylyltransferase [Ruminococcus sp.]